MALSSKQILPRNLKKIRRLLDVKKNTMTKQRKDIKKPEILIIGIDGATFSLITPWVDAGELPTFKYLMENGSWGDLKSTMPPITSPAWTSFMTGKNPGKHGIFHFISPKDKSYDFFYTNASTRKCKTIWKILNEYGKKAGVYNVPMTFPPESIDGYMISGMGTPGIDSEFIYPSSIKSEIKKVFKQLKLDMVHLEYMRSDEKRDIVLKEMAELEDYRADLSLYLLRNHPVDIFMVVFCSVDQIQHYFWHYMDKEHYKYDSEGAKKYGDTILKAYKKIDEKINQLVNEVSEDTTIVLMSDHGAGPLSDKILYLNNILSEIGVLKFKEKCRSSFSKDVIKILDPILRRTLTPKQKMKIAKLFPKLREKWETRLTSLSSIDWANTKAFSYEILPSDTTIWINLKDKFPNGTVNEGSEYDELLDYITEKLLDLKDPGKNIIKNVLKKDDLFKGRYSDMAPDLLLNWWDDDGFTIRSSSQEKKKDFVRTVNKTDSDSLVNWSGTHRLNGIFLLMGKPFKKINIPSGVDIVDLAPTLLYVMGYPIPEDMDGKVIEAVFNEDYIKSNPIQYVSNQFNEKDKKEHTYSEEETLIIQKKLQDLGYLE